MTSEILGLPWPLKDSELRTLKAFADVITEYDNFSIADPRIIADIVHDDYSFFSDEYSRYIFLRTYFLEHNFPDSLSKEETKALFGEIKFETFRSEQFKEVISDGIFKGTLAARSRKSLVPLLSSNMLTLLRTSLVSNVAPHIVLGRYAFEFDFSKNEFEGPIIRFENYTFSLNYSLDISRGRPTLNFSVQVFAFAEDHTTSEVSAKIAFLSESGIPPKTVEFQQKRQISLSDPVSTKPKLRRRFSIDSLDSGTKKLNFESLRKDIAEFDGNLIPNENIPLNVATKEIETVGELVTSRRVKTGRRSAGNIFSKVKQSSKKSDTVYFGVADVSLRVLRELYLDDTSKAKVVVLIVAKI